MIAYKAFYPGLICRGYQFVMGKNITDKANCKKNGFHCAGNPLDCLSYYPDMKHSEYYIVNAGGDIDEVEDDTKISCTELTIIKKLTKEDFFLHGLAYMVDHPLLENSPYVALDSEEARNGYAIVRGKAPRAKGGLGDILAFAQEDPESRHIIKIAMTKVDGKKVVPGKWYGIDLTERQMI